MRVALTVWDDRISPLFDSAVRLMTTDIEAGHAGNRCYHPFPLSIPMIRAAQLFELGTDALICGAISERSAHMLDAYGIQLTAFITGNIDTVLSAFLDGSLSGSAFRMPGCRHRNRAVLESNCGKKRHSERLPEQMIHPGGKCRRNRR